MFLWSVWNILQFHKLLSKEPILYFRSWKYHNLCLGNLIIWVAIAIVIIWILRYFFFMNPTSNKQKNSSIKRWTNAFCAFRLLSLIIPRYHLMTKQLMQKLNRRLAQKREKMDIFMRSSEFFCEFNSTYFYHHADMTWQKFREIKQYVFYLGSCLSIIVLFLKCRWRLVSAATVPKGGQSLSLPRPLLQ